MQKRQRAVFIDASVSATTPFDYSRRQPCRNSYTSHAMSSAALLAVYEEVCGEPLSDDYLPGIPGYQFELGTTTTAQVRAHIENVRDLCGNYFCNGRRRSGLLDAMNKASRAHLENRGQMAAPTICSLSLY